MVIPKINSAHGPDTRNIINAAIDLINTQGKSIQDLVAKGQLTPSQYAQLISIVNGNVKKGGITSDDIDKNNFRLDQTHLSDELLQQMAGNTPVNAVPADGSITTEKLNDASVTFSKLGFLENTENLFDGNYRTGFMDFNGSYRTDGTNGRIAVVRIQPETNYAIKIHEPEKSNMFAISTLNQKPNFGSEYKTATRIIFDESLNEYIFKSGEDAKYMLIYVSGQSIGNPEPHLKVERGTNFTAFKGYPKIPSRLTGKHKIESNELPVVTADKLDILEKKEENIFDGTYNEGYILAIYGDINMGVYEYKETENGVTVVIPVKPNTKYYIKKFDASDRFRVATFEGEPVHISPVKRSLIADDSANELVFTTTSTENYIAAQLSFSNEKPRIMVSEKGFYENYINRYEIKREYIQSDFTTKSLKNSYITGNFSEYVKTETRLPMEQLGISNILNSQTSDVYRWYDELMTIPHLNMTKKIIGYATDVNGGENTELPIIEWTFNTTETNQGGQNGYSNDLEKSPTLLFTSGVHGNEKGAVYGLYHFLKQVTENENDKDAFASLFSQFNIKVVPVVNPHGYNNGNRNNARNVNINRNFSYKWEKFAVGEKGATPYSEHETEALKTWFEDNSNAAAYLDYHNFTRNFSGRKPEMNSYHFSPVSEMDKMYSALIRKSSYYWKEKYMGGYSGNDNISYGFLNSAFYMGVPSTINEAYHKFGIKLSATPESASEDPANLNSLYTVSSCELSTEIIMNYTLSMIDNFIK